MLFSMENIMIMTATKFNLSALAALAVMAIAPQFSGSAQASVTSDLMNCRYNTRQQTINCCEQILKINDRPQWLRSNGGSCAGVVKCVAVKQTVTYVAAAPKPKCFIQIPLDDNQRSSTPNDNPRQNQRPSRSFK
jgi:hypothetical protein